MKTDELADTVTDRPRRQYRLVIGNFARVADQARATGDRDSPARESPRVKNVRLISQNDIPRTYRRDHGRPTVTPDDNVTAVDHMAHQLNGRQIAIAERDSSDTYGSEQAQHLGTANGHKAPVSNVRTRHTLPHRTNWQKRAEGLRLTKYADAGDPRKHPIVTGRYCPCRPHQNRHPPTITPRPRHPRRPQPHTRPPHSSRTPPHTTTPARTGPVRGTNTAATAAGLVSRAGRRSAAGRPWCGCPGARRTRTAPRSPHGSRCTRGRRTPSGRAAPGSGCRCPAARPRRR
jgi:hypothetical protein